jgi:hypothetical protein
MLVEQSNKKRGKREKRKKRGEEGRKRRRRRKRERRRKGRGGRGSNKTDPVAEGALVLVPLVVSWFGTSAFEKGRLPGSQVFSCPGQHQVWGCSVT